MQFKFKMVSGWVNLQWWWHAVIALIIGRISQKMSIGPLRCTVQNREGKFCWCCDVVLLGASIGPNWSWSSPSRSDGINALVVEICLSLCGLCCFFLNSYCDSKFWITISSFWGTRNIIPRQVCGCPRHWYPSMDAPSMENLKVRLDQVLSTLIELFLLFIAGKLEKMAFKGPFQLIKLCVCYSDAPHHWGICETSLVGIRKLQADS